MRITTGQFDKRTAIYRHVQLLGHDSLGVTELRIVSPTVMVAYADSVKDVVRLADEMDSKAAGIYVGVQPRSVCMLDYAPNCWRPAIEKGKSNCAQAKDIEYITTIFFDIDAVPPQREKGHPASDNELQKSLQAARLLGKQTGLIMSSTICCSGNGHYVLAPLVPIAVDCDGVAAQFRQFCRQLADEIAAQVSGVRIDPVYDLSRIMRLMGTVNRKGKPTPDRPHRRAHFVTEPLPAKSQALYYMILDTESAVHRSDNNTPSTGIKCDLAKIEACDFIRWCREHAAELAEPLWFDMITNLAHLEGGPELIHKISRLDTLRYEYQQTQRLIERVKSRSYGPASCMTIRSNGFDCRKLGQCGARAPMYLTDLFSIWNKIP